MRVQELTDFRIQEILGQEVAVEIMIEGVRSPKDQSIVIMKLTGAHRYQELHSQYITKAVNSFDYFLLILSL